MNEKKVLLSCAIAVSFMGFEASWAKPMPAPTKEGAFNSKYILIAEYVGYVPNQRKIEYFQPPFAEYKVLRVLKGDERPHTLKLRYDFSDGSACIAPKPWEFNKQLMPNLKTKWLLFLVGKNSGNIFSSYRGTFGRIEATKQNILEVEAFLKRSR